VTRTGLGLLALVVACGPRGASAPPDGLEGDLCATEVGTVTDTQARAILEALQPAVEIAVDELDPVSPLVAAAWTYEAHLFTQRASVLASGVRLGITIEGKRQPDVPLAARVVAPLLGESNPAGHWDWVEVPPACRFEFEPVSDNPLCRVLTTLPMFNPLTFALWPLFLPNRQHVEKEPTWDDWEHVAPKAADAVGHAGDLLPELPTDSDWSTVDLRAGLVIVEAPVESSSLALSVSVDARTCDRRIAIDVALPAGTEIEAWLAEQGTAKRTQVDATAILGVRELGSVADLQFDDREDVDAFLSPEDGVSCDCDPDECRCFRRGPAYLQSDARGPFSWKTPLCCASADWADDGTCSCTPVGCSRMERRKVRKCVCQPWGTIDDPAWTPVERCAPTDTEVCCADGFGCSCSTHRGPCFGDEVAVASCGPETVTCREPPAELGELAGAPGHGRPTPACELP